jgi:hypothetical protein
MTIAHHCMIIAALLRAFVVSPRETAASMPC